MELPELHVGKGWAALPHLYNEKRCSLQKDELAEVARRSNLFPKLVEALERLLQASGHSHESNWYQECDGATPWEQARSILSEASNGAENEKQAL